MMEIRWTIAEIRHKDWAVLLMLIIMVAIGNHLCLKLNMELRSSQQQSEYYKIYFGDVSVSGGTDAAKE